MKLQRLPGLIDLHVHLRTPGQTDKEDFLTGTSAALSGGFTTIFDMPNNKIPITTKERLMEKIAIARKQIVCDVGFYFGSLGDNLSEFEKVKQKVMGLKLYLNETTGNFLIDKKTLSKIFEAWPSGPILVHAEDDAVAAVIDNVKRTGKHAHFCHISLASDLRQIMKAKKENLPITCGVTPHHLFLTEKDTRSLGTFGRMKPYLKSKRDVDFLWKHLSEIDAVESDHAPHTIVEKRGETPPFGVPGLETTLPLLFNAIYEKRLTLGDVIRLCHTAPAKILGLKPDKKTYIEIDTNKPYTLDHKFLFTKCGWSPFEGMKFKGKVMRVHIRGEKVFEDGKILAKAGLGNIQYPHQTL